jgi:FkbM family methyltransferase
VRVFVDVGAHYGESLQVARDPAWNFDRLLAIEPASTCHSLLRGFRDERVSVHPVALGPKNGVATLYGAGLLGGTLFSSKKQKADVETLKSETISLVRASDWFRDNVPSDAQIFVKFNCEGAECDIIDDLLDAGLGPRLTSLYIDFDVRKVPELTHRRRQVENRLTRQDIRYTTPEALDASGAKAIAKWLSADCGRSHARGMAVIRYRLGLDQPLYLTFRGLAARIMPRRVYWWLGHRFGRLAPTGE